MGKKPSGDSRFLGELDLVGAGHSASADGCNVLKTLRDGWILRVSRKKKVIRDI